MCTASRAGHTPLHVQIPNPHEVKDVPDPAMDFTIAEPQPPDSKWPETGHHAKTSFTTRDGSTPVNFMSRP